MKKYFKRFKQFDFVMWITCISMFVFSIIGFYFSISMTVKISLKKTLFGSSTYTENKIELTGPTANDIIVVVIFWILTLLLFSLFIYYAFIKKIKVDADVIDNNDSNEKDKINEQYKNE